MARYRRNILYFYKFIYILYLDFCIISCARSNEEKPTECSTTSSQSELNSFLWTLERDPPSYFFGTIHVPYSRVWDYIPISTKNAFRYSENVYLELDLTDSSTATALANCQILPERKTISDYLPNKLYRRLNRYMEYIRRKIPDWMGEEHQKKADADYYADYQYRAILGSWQRMKPVWLMLLLNSLTESDIRLFGVPVLDLYLSRQAVQWQKNLGAIEQPDEQCGPLDKLNNTQVIFALDQTLRQHEKQREKSQSMPENDDLINHYNCGDLQSVLLKKDTLKIDLASLQPQESELTRMAREMDKFFEEELLYKRNERMAERILKLLEDNPNESYFFAFGAGHFLGNNSVIDKLVSSGLPIKHTKPESHIQSHSKRESNNQGSFSHMDSAIIASNPYIETMRKLDEQGTSGRATRHGKKKQKKKSRRERPYGVVKSEEKNFTNLWIRVEEISQVTEDPTLYSQQQSVTTSSSQTQRLSIYLFLYLMILGIYLD